MNGLSDLLSSPIFWSVALAVVVSQGGKLLFLILKKDKSLVLSDVFMTGGMPSTHSAVVIALTVILYLTEGFTPLFFLAFVLACIVIRDAVGVRRTVGEESKVLTDVVKVLKKKLHLNISRKMHENLGHQPIEVFVGTLLGIMSAVGIYLLFL
jgi:uncharacterized protein